jgi:hypothetical protein
MDDELEDFSDISRYAKHVHMFQYEVVKIWQKGRKSKAENNALYDCAKKYGISPDYAAATEEMVIENVCSKLIRSSVVEHMDIDIDEEEFKEEIDSLYNSRDSITPLNQLKIFGTGELLAYSPGEVWELTYEVTKYNTI